MLSEVGEQALVQALCLCREHHTQNRAFTANVPTIKCTQVATVSEPGLFSTVGSSAGEPDACLEEL